MSIKRISIKSYKPETAAGISRELGINPFLAEVLAARGFDSPQAALDFLREGKLGDPFELADMDKAAGRVALALENGEKICVYGDYDSDGVCSVALLMLYFTSMDANAFYYVPEREEGYGLNKKAVEKIAAQGANLIITVDNGISAFEEAELAAALGLDLIITDHHQAHETLPKAVAVLDPHRPDCPSAYKDLCGAGVALKLLAALEGSYELLLENFADILAVATIGDIVPLAGENRFLVREGLRRLRCTGNAGLAALIELLGTGEKLDARTVAFTIVPHINAAGRLGSAETALRLLLAENPEEAAELAAKLHEINLMRQSIEISIKNDIEDEIAQRPRLIYDSVLTIAREGWNHGVIGISASHVVERWSKPCFLFGVKDGIATGSGRGVEGVSLFELLCDSGDLIIKYGGHEKAAGLTLEEKKLPALTERFNAYITSRCKAMPVDGISADICAKPCQLTVENVKSLDLLRPFGCDNDEVLIMLQGCVLREIAPLSGGKYSRLRFDCGGESVSILDFSRPAAEFSYKKYEKLDLIVKSGINIYNNRESVSLKLVYARLSGFDSETYFKSRWIFDRFMRGEIMSEDEKLYIIPDRDFISKVYRFLKSGGGFAFGYERLAEYMGNYAKMRLSLLVLKEFRLISAEKKPGGETAIKIIPGAAKIKLEDSAILDKLRNMKCREG
ncbi:MAG: single-stranded-DNA-specific exonuclease RecJ [Oscillospiraceae bacterium]|nr:single-stranded-DNA-specific exonuclease RecJ [Oscillospiraceae bacterium]